MTTFKIAIIGAGPASCTLARLLLQSSTPVELTIFESETSLNDRSQGGTLDLHPETGIEALKQAGLYDEFLKYARYDGEAFRICDKKKRTYIKLGGTTSKTSRGRPEIDRIQLRRILVESLPDGLIRWGHHLKSVEDVDGTFSLHFHTSIETGFDLIVGADGAWSHVRSVLTDVKPQYSGITGVSLSIEEPEKSCPDLYEFVNRGSAFAFGDARSIMAQQLGDGRISMSAWIVESEDWIDQFKDMDENTVKSTLLKGYSDWDPELRKLVEASDGPQIPRNLYMLPIGTRWKHRPGITVLGDAAHVTTPFAGEGVNLAMTDALKLSNFIITAAKTGTLEALSEQVKAFEEDMFVRATKIQQLTFDMMTCMYFTPGAPYTTIEKWCLTAAGHDLNPLYKALLSVALYTYFWFWRLFN